MTRIRKFEAEYLRAIGLEKDVKVSNTTHQGKAKTYYMVESRDAIAAMREFRSK